MPYIKQSQQARLKTLLDKIFIGEKGELCYCINVLQMKFCEGAVIDNKLSYQILSDAVAAANDANSEFYRRVIFKYEAHKIRENGDIFHDFIRKANI
mgnify:FL=1